MIVNSNYFKSSLVGLAVLLSGPAMAEPLTLESPVEQVTVVELFTSHGCSSCPPADRWLRSFTDHPDLWKRVIPLAFHVDYWDYLGWSDRFADPAYSLRQRAYRRAGGLSSVYTPGFLVNGKEWRGWFRGAEPEIAPGPEVGVLRVEVERGREVKARFTPGPDWQGGELRAHLALLGFGLSTDVGGGENSGRTLQEDFVILGTAEAVETVQGVWRLPWPELKAAAPVPKAVVVWLSGVGSPAPLQLAGGWLPEVN